MRKTWPRLAAVVVAMLATGALALSMPPDVKLGKLLRFVTFHGASTWVNMMLFTLLGAVAVVYLVRRREGVGRWESAVRYVALPLWMVNTGLGMVSSELSWGAVNWSEPRLRASFYILIAAAVVLVAQHLVDRLAVTAALDAVFVGAFWALLLSAPNLMHPDNPVLHSGWEVKGPFIGMVACWAVAMGLIVWMLRDAIVAWHASAAE